MGSVSGDSGHGSSHIDAYDELFHTPSVVDLDPLDNDQEEMGNKVSIVLCVDLCTVKSEFLKIRVNRYIWAVLFPVYDSKT